MATITSSLKARGVLTSRDSASRAHLVALAAVTAIAFAVRLSQIHQGLFGDELFTYGWDAGRHLHVGNSDNPPLFFVLAWLSARLGNPAVSLRLPSLILSTATVPLTYRLGSRTVGALPGLIGAVVVAVDPFTIFYGVEARPYATMMFFVVLSTLALVRAAGTASGSWWAVYALATAAATYSHFSAIFVIAVQAGWSLWVCRDRLRAPLLANGGALALYIPWLSHVHGHQGFDIIAILAPVHVGTVFTDMASVYGGYPFASLSRIPTDPLLVVLLAATTAGFAAFARSRAWVRLPDAGGSPRSLVLLVLVAAATPVGLLAYTLFVVDIWGSRQLLASLPAFALLAGAGLVALPRPLRAFAAAAVVAVLIVGAAVSISPASRRPDLPGAARFINDRATPGSTAIYVPLFGSTGALSRGLSIYVKAGTTVTTSVAAQSLARAWESHRELFVVSPVVGGHPVALSFPSSPHRPVLETAGFKGVVTYQVTEYGP